MFNTATKVVAVAGTPEQLATDVKCYLATIQAKVGNTGPVFIGHTAAAANGSSGTPLPIQAGGSVDVGGIKGLDEVWLDVSTSGDGVDILYLV